MAKRTHPAHRGILSLFIAAIFAYLLLVFLGPFVLGPWVLLVAAAIGGFVVFIIVLGVALQLSSPTIGSGAVLFALGGGLINLAIFIGLGILAEGDPRYALGVPFIVEEQDTTEDH